MAAVSTIDSHWQNLMLDSLAVNTKRTYSSVQRQFIEFCERQNLLHDNGSPLPASELTLLRFIGIISKNLQASSMKVYLSAIRSFHLIYGFKDLLSGIGIVLRDNNSQ